MEGGGDPSVPRCAICDCSLHLKPSVVVRVKGLKTLHKASVLRNDGLIKVFKAVKSIELHVNCRYNYISSYHISKHCAEKSTASSFGVNIANRRSSLPQFDFKMHCLFCGKLADEELERKKEISKRTRISNASTIEMKVTVRQKVLGTPDTEAVRCDDWGREVLARLDSAIDMVSAEARYHSVCYLDFCKPKKSSLPVGGQRHPEKSEAFAKLCNFLISNEECQFSLIELSEKLRDFLPDNTENYSIKHFSRLLTQRFGGKILISNTPGKVSTVSFLENAGKILSDKWYTDKEDDIQLERRRIVETAAAIIREDIRSTVYNTDEFPLPASLTNESLIPETLRLFTKAVILKGKQHNKNNLRKCVAIEHQIIAATRPRSFMSPLQYSLGVHLHRHFASRYLLDILSSLGICVNYTCVKLYESSILFNLETTVDPDAFLQIVFDNADFNVRTIDGHGTFHVMGGIRCITPASAVTTGGNIPRLKKVPSADVIGQFGKVAIIPFKHNLNPGLRGVTVEDLSLLPTSAPLGLPMALSLDCLWLSGTWLDVPLRPGWSGYMEVSMKGSKHHQVSRVLPLPFINLDPGNVSCIHTALKFAADQCRKQRQRHCMVTFDQPLYAKAAEMVAGSNDPDLSTIIVRLGGFHLLMSYMGSIGYIMAGSGLEELWATIYAKGSVGHMITGHAYARALRAHFMTQQALGVVMLNQLALSDVDVETREVLKTLYTDLMDNAVTPAAAAESEALRRVTSALTSVLEGQHPRTAALWIQYYQQVQLIRLYVRAERSGDWHLHLHCVREMLPYFHAAAHLPYAKSAQLYFQHMTTLQSKMAHNDFQKFTDDGYFTIRRTDKLWAGIWSDMTIEQVLMRQMKTQGGVTQGRGLTDSTLTQWIMCMPACIPITEAVEDFCGVLSGSSEQHVELRTSRQARDREDVTTFTSWFAAHSPFSDLLGTELTSLSSGVVANKRVNCDAARAVGLTAMEKMVGTTFLDLKLKRNDKVLSLAAASKGIRIRDEVVHVNTMQLFNRIICVMRTDTQLSECLQFELAPFPPSLFSDASLRKTNKAVLAAALEQLVPCTASVPLEVQVFVVDGGYLLHCVVWPRPATYMEIFTIYVKYLRRHFGNQVIVVFDGYLRDASSMKVAEQRRRGALRTTADIAFTDDMLATTAQADFLANAFNKTRFINRLTSVLRAETIEVYQAAADADMLIVNTAIQEANAGRRVAIVGTDTDLLVLAVALAEPTADVTLFKPGTARISPKAYSTQLLQDALGVDREHILFLHAVSGCDTTSALFLQGKRKALKILSRKESLRQTLKVFNSPDADAETIAAAGEKFLIALYGDTTSTSLDALRFISYKRTVAKQALSSNFDLATLPPTTAAARQHSFRVYHQVQQWRGNNLPATLWGWKLENDELHPVPTLQLPAPDQLLNVVSCNCKTSCSGKCSCVRAGLRCSHMCSQCNGATCNNAILLEEDPDDPEMN